MILMQNDSYCLPCGKQLSLLIKRLSSLHKGFTTSSYKDNKKQMSHELLNHFLFWSFFFFLNNSLPKKHLEREARASLEIFVLGFTPFSHGGRGSFYRPFKQWHGYFLLVGFVLLLLSLYSACQCLKAQIVSFS